ncbi:hypothetical protein ACFFK0_28995 [Paenibacillus chartarius]|uniref:Uncharacterized protein n=1 Tax=Paenibacillus chartarius TaxID=747481 RepID=A0ABV6DV81_9BACL
MMATTKKCIIIGIIACSFLFPGSAFAAAGSSVQTMPLTQSYFSQLLAQFFSIFGSNSRTGSYESDYSKQLERERDQEKKRKHEKEFEEWYESNRENCPDGESGDIWSRWYTYDD